MKNAMKWGSILTGLFLSLALLFVIGASAQAATPPTPQFAFTGFIQEATLDTTGAVCTPAPQTNALGGAVDVSRLRGGTITVNGIRMIVPCNTLLQLPAATMMWADLFDPAVSAPVGSNVGSPLPLQGSGQTRLALADSTMPFPSFEVSVNGNVVGKNDGTIPGLAAGTDKYIVGLIVPIEQQVLNGSSGLVSFIDYVSGSFRVGGLVGDVNCTQGGVPGGGPLCSGALVQFNDPIQDAGADGLSGRWGKTHSIDPRFSGDDVNTTIHTSTGFPLCIPRVAPPGTLGAASTGIDTECPIGNRPLNGDSRFPTDPFIAVGQPLKIFNMPCPAGTLSCPAGQPPAVGGYPDPTKQVPLMVGDQVNYIGTIFKIDPLATRTVANPDGTTSIIPDNTAANSYMSAHTVEDVLGIFTAPGIPPAYISIEGMLIGTNGAAVQGIIQEASTRMTVVGFTSDPTRLVDIYAQDVNPCSGQVTLRFLATTDPAADALVGRFVHRVLGGLFMPPTRNYTIRSRTQLLDPITGLRVPQTVANGILAGEFSLPLFEYIFPENHRLGDPILPNNYQDLPFLALGSGPVDGFGSGTAILGQLNPWPGSAAPAALTCAPGGGTSPAVLVNPATISVGTGAAVTLNGAVNFDPLDNPASRTSVWTQISGTPVTLTQGGTVAARSATFIAPAAAGTLVFTLTATDNFGTGSATEAVLVLQATDIVQITVASWVEQNGKRGPFGKLAVTATSSNPAANLTLLEDPVEDATHPASCPFTAPVLGGICDWGTASKTSPGVYDWVENKGAPQPLSLTVRSDKGGSATVTCSAADARGRVTCP